MPRTVSGPQSAVNTCLLIDFTNNPEVSQKHDGNKNVPPPTSQDICGLRWEMEPLSSARPQSDGRDSFSSSLGPLLSRSPLSERGDSPVCWWWPPEPNSQLWESTLCQARLRAVHVPCPLKIAPASAILQMRILRPGKGEGLPLPPSPIPHLVPFCAGRFPSQHSAGCFLPTLVLAHFLRKAISGPQLPPSPPSYSHSGPLGIYCAFLSWALREGEGATFAGLDASLSFPARPWWKGGVGPKAAAAVAGVHGVGGPGGGGATLRRLCPRLPAEPRRREAALRGARRPRL